MANAFAMIDEAIWRRDKDFRALPRFAQCTFLQLLSQRDVDCAGILTLHVDLLAKGCDELTADDIWGDLKALEAARFVYYDTDTDELLVRSYIRRIAARSPNILKAALKAARAVVSPKLRSVLAVELHRLNKAEATAVANEIDAGWNPSETLSEPFPNPSETGNPSRTLPEPPSCSSVVDQLSPSVDGCVGGTRARGSARTEPTQPKPDLNEPSPFCPGHPDGTDRPCGPCGRARKRYDEWHAAQAVAATEAQKARNAAIRDCPDCDPVGWLLDPDTHEPVEPATRCTHHDWGSGHA
ncbi:hypothetical protein [Mycobacterium sp. DL440]|uniref:hypothetical protein n=1 Tax=Mycobacterium sp. DL440 TaxID=2675523 RepID=UPI001422CE01|nr:hypothetical protein [Mycobacterium sp. DL440]